ncbi:MAG: alpha/beta hydrolase [Treponema sp.]|nr:alpha/beta hydrolase [Treponema sp.]
MSRKVSVVSKPGGGVPQGFAPSMKPWPALAPLGRVLRPHDDDKAVIFYYDTRHDAPAAAPPHEDAKPVIILIHGLGDDADSWRGLIPLLSGTFRVVAPDLPGFGRSVVSGRAGITRHVSAILALLADTGPAILAGSSMGALVAEETAMIRPDLVRGLVLLDGCIPTAADPDKSLLRMALPFVGKRWFRALRNDREGAWRSLFGYYADIMSLPQADRQFLRERVIARVESSSQERAYFDSLRSLIFRNAVHTGRFTRFLPKFSGKILIIWGAEDAILPPESSRPIRALRPDAAFNLIPGAGHLPHQEKPEETASIILQFSF